MIDKAQAVCVHVGSFSAGFMDGLGFASALLIVGLFVGLYVYNVYARERD